MPHNQSPASAIDLERLKYQLPSTPAFVLDISAISQTLDKLAFLRQSSGCKILYSIKALPLSSVLELAKPVVDGFSVSSLFETQLADEILGGCGSIHLTTPGLKENEWPAISRIVSHVSFNSLSQRQRYRHSSPPSLSQGIRVNPKLSFLDDDRFNPARAYSKLGIAIADVNQLSQPESINGLHCHNIFSATTFEPLQKTVAALMPLLNNPALSLQWLNLGGGYLYNQIDCQLFIDAVKQLKAAFNLDVFIEPGKAVVGQAGYLVATVLDVFNSDGKTIAILDSSINHHPEVFEYQRQPELHEHDPRGEYPALLAGCTCLAGDLFGEYSFTKPIQVGDKVVFKHIGAYSLIKANRFNGYPLPDIYLSNNNQLSKIKQDSYPSYRQQWLADK